MIKRKRLWMVPELRGDDKCAFCAGDPDIELCRAIGKLCSEAIAIAPGNHEAYVLAAVTAKLTT